MSAYLCKIVWQIGSMRFSLFVLFHLFIYGLHILIWFSEMLSTMSCNSSLFQMSSSFLYLKCACWTHERSFSRGESSFCRSDGCGKLLIEIVILLTLVRLEVRCGICGLICCWFVVWLLFSVVFCVVELCCVFINSSIVMLFCVLLSCGVFCLSLCLLGCVCVVLSLSIVLSGTVSWDHI